MIIFTDLHVPIFLGRVVCQQFGYSNGFAVIRSDYFPGSDPIWLSNLRCQGTESRLTECVHNGWGVHSCGHYWDAGVDCFNEREHSSYAITQIVANSTTVTIPKIHL